MRQVPPSTRSPDMVRRPISRLVWNNRHATQLCVPTRTRSLTGFPLVGEVDVCESPDLKADRSVCYEQSTKCPKLISRKTATRRHSPYLPHPRPALSTLTQETHLNATVNPLASLNTPSCGHFRYQQSSLDPETLCVPVQQPRHNESSPLLRSKQACVKHDPRLLGPSRRLCNLIGAHATASVAPCLPLSVVQHVSCKEVHLQCVQSDGYCGISWHRSRLNVLNVMVVVTLPRCLSRRCRAFRDLAAALSATRIQKTRRALWRTGQGTDHARQRATP